jgi:hypothetical protein
MVGFAAAAGFAGIRSVISIGARLGAITKFQQLSGAVQGSNNSLVRFGAGALMAAGKLSLLSGAISLLTGPAGKLGGLLGLFQVGLSTVRFVQFERAARLARLSFQSVGIDVSRTNERLRDFAAILGRTTASELFLNTEAMVNFAKVGGEVANQIALTAEAMEDAGFGELAKEFAAVAPGAFVNQDDLDRLREMVKDLTGLNTKTMDAAELVQILNDKFVDLDVTNVEQVGLEFEKIQDILDPVLGRIGNFLALLTLIPLTIARWELEAMKTYFEAIGDVIEPVVGIFQTLYDLMVEYTPLGMSFELQLKAIGEALKFIGDNIVWLIPGYSAWVLWGTILGTVNDKLKDAKKFIEDIIATKVGPWFKDVFGEDGTIRTTVGKAITWMSENLGPFFTETLPGFISGLSGKIGALAKEFIVVPIMKAINWVIEQWNNLDLELPGILGGGRVGTPNIPLLTLPSFAQGGTVPGALGQPRLVIAHGGERISPNNKDMVININIGGDRLETIIVDTVNRTARLRGGVTPSSIFGAG